MGDMRVSMLVEMKAAAARAEAAGLRGEIEKLGVGAVNAGQATARGAAAITGLAAASNAALTAVTAQATALQQVSAATDGVTAATQAGTAATEASTAAEQQHGVALEELRARFDPLFAASRRYEQELREIAEAERLGALSAVGAAAARDRAAQSLTPLASGLRRVGSEATNTGMAVTQLGYQFNDIGMMIAAGQNPLMLALQQGSQITQVLGPMGAGGALKALGGAFMGLLKSYA